MGGLLAARRTRRGVGARSGAFASYTPAVAASPVHGPRIMVHPDTELRFVSPAIGRGVFATRPIPRGTIVWALDVLDQRFHPSEVAVLPAYAKAQLQKYAYVDARGDHVLCWDHARFFNHSCDANCLSVGYEFELAVRDIAAGEELTDDYGTLNPSEPFPCACGGAGCRGAVLPDDAARIGATWNRLASDAFGLIRTVPQPLWDVVSDRARVEAALDDPRLLRPIQDHFSASRPA